MKRPLLALVLFCLCLSAIPTFAQDAPRYTIDTLPPVVIATIPMVGEKAVDPETTEILVSFSREMKPGIWSWNKVNDETFPDITGKIRYLDDHRTCVLPVRLDPDKTYIIWINSEKSADFRDMKDRPAVPYLLYFKTKKL